MQPPHPSLPHEPSREHSVPTRVRRRPRRAGNVNIAFALMPSLIASPWVAHIQPLPLAYPTMSRKPRPLHTTPSLLSGHPNHNFFSMHTPRVAPCAAPLLGANFSHVTSPPELDVIYKSLPAVNESGDLSVASNLSPSSSSSSSSSSSPSIHSQFSSSSDEIELATSAAATNISFKSIGRRKWDYQRSRRDFASDEDDSADGRSNFDSPSRQRRTSPSSRRYSDTYNENDPRDKFHVKHERNDNSFENSWSATSKENVRRLHVDPLKKLNTPINAAQFEDILATLSRQRRIKTALEVLQLAENGPLKEEIAERKSLRLYTIMIDLYGKGFQLSRAFALFYSMDRNNVKPNVITYNAMIAACSRSNEPDLAYEMFEEMCTNKLSPDKFTYGALINSCAKCGQVERAFEISRLMDKDGVMKDQTVYSALMDACGRAEQLERALMVFEEMKQKGVWPNLVTFSVLIDICANAREPTRAFQLFSEMKHWGITKGNVIVYTALIDACAKSGWPEKAELVLKAMVEKRLKPNEITFGALMEGWAKEGQVDKAFYVLERMVKEFKVLPNAVLIGGLIEVCRKRLETWRVGKLWQVVMEYNIRPSKTFYPPLIAMALIQDDLRLATAVVLHAYARGFLRRAALNSGDPSLHTIACAIVYYRYEMVKRKGNVVDGGGGGGKVNQSAMERVGTVFKSMGMTEEDMDLMSPLEAKKRCMLWGEPETRDTMGVRVRNGSRRDRKGVHRKDLSLSQAARRAKDAASSGEHAFGNAARG